MNPASEKVDLHGVRVDDDVPSGKEVQPRGSWKDRFVYQGHSLRCSGIAYFSFWSHGASAFSLASIGVGFFSLGSVLSLFSVLSLNSLCSLLCLNCVFSVFSLNSSFSVNSVDSYVAFGCNGAAFKVCDGRWKMAGMSSNNTDMMMAGMGDMDMMNMNMNSSSMGDMDMMNMNSSSMGSMDGNMTEDTMMMDTDAPPMAMNGTGEMMNSNSTAMLSDG
jgi:hypothetical protein